MTTIVRKKNFTTGRYYLQKSPIFLSDGHIKCLALTSLLNIIYFRVEFYLLSVLQDRKDDIFVRPTDTEVIFVLTM